MWLMRVNAIDPCASQPDNSDLNVIPIYSKCSPFKPPKADTWDNRIINMASKDPVRVKYLSTLERQSPRPQSLRARPSTSATMCFKSYYFSGSLKLGPVGQPKSIRTTPLLRSPHRPSLYYVNFTGISVGRVLVPFPSEYLGFNPNTGSGTIIDSGTVITRFVEPVYNAVREEFRKQVGGTTFTSIGAFDTCFVKTYETLAPPITLHFEGLDLKLPLENSLIHSSAGSLACLAMAAAPDNVNSVLNVIANFQQQNLRILFDIVNNKVGIARELARFGSFVGFKKSDGCG
ncbi:Aspartic proteinase nepenthesin-1 [Glycine soja]|nr:Aspartic proteinase nepenthesin-1 [Glycine soja]